LPGLYRIRARDDAVLGYIGQTGRSVLERLRALRGVYGTEMPYRDPHTAGPALWAWIKRDGVELEASVAPVAADAVERKALEAVAIALHRQEHGVSPRWSFGRMPAGYAMSSGNNARLVAAGTRHRGGETSDELAAHVAGVPPRGPLDGHVESTAWCGHQWSPWRPLTAANLASVPNGEGLYRMRGAADGLVYVGEGRVRARLAAHAHKLNQQSEQGRVFRRHAPLEFSALLDEGWLSHQRLELETDLIAAHALALGRPPAAQFIG